MFTSTGISVQGQDRYPRRAAINTQGEQTLNKDAQTQKALRVINGLSDYKTIYKSLRPKQVVNSVLRVTKFVNVVENQYISALGLGAEVLNQVDKGKGLPEDFNKNRIFNTNTKFHTAMIKNDCKSFMNLKKSCIVKNKTNDVQVTKGVNKNIIGSFKSFCLKAGISMEYKKALLDTHLIGTLEVYAMQMDKNSRIRTLISKASFSNL